jgi:chromosome segregation ATPase
MPVNLEELALKSIEQYAQFGARLLSLEQSLLDINRRGEIGQEKFIAACDKISRLEEKLSSITTDKVIIHKRIDDTRVELDKVIKAIDDLTGKVKNYSDHHCDNCANGTKLEELENKLDEHINGNKYAIEVRKALSSYNGLTVVNFLISKYFTIFIVLCISDILLDLYVHHDALKTLIVLLKFW